MNVGFIGLGRMGQAMARNLLKAGHRVFVFNRTRSRAEELRDEGAEVADSPAGVCKGDIVITMLADDDAVEEIVLGSGGDCCYSNNTASQGTFYEGAIVAGYPSDATDSAIQANIVSAGYGK